jgi:hypothetical protein
VAKENMKTKIETRTKPAPKRNRFAIFIFSVEPAGAIPDSTVQAFNDSTKIFHA